MSADRTARVILYYVGVLALAVGLLFADLPFGARLLIICGVLFIVGPPQ